MYYQITNQVSPTPNTSHEWPTNDPVSLTNPTDFALTPLPNKPPTAGKFPQMWRRTGALRPISPFSLKTSATESVTPSSLGPTAHHRQQKPRVSNPSPPIPSRTLGTLTNGIGVQGMKNMGLRCFGGSRFEQLRVVDALRRGDRNGALNFLGGLVDGVESLSAADFCYVLEYCSETPDPLFSLETWKLMEAKAIDIDSRSSRLILQAFSRGGYLKEAFNWLNFLGNNDHATLPMFNIFLNGCQYPHSMNYFGLCLELMEDQFIGKSETTYCELLKLAARQKNLAAVHELWHEYTKFYSPSILPLRKFIWCFSKLADLESAHAALKYLLEFVQNENVILSKSDKGRYRSLALDIPIPVSRSNEGRFSLKVLHSSQSLLDRNSTNYFPAKSSLETSITESQPLDETLRKEMEEKYRTKLQHSGDLKFTDDTENIPLEAAEEIMTQKITVIFDDTAEINDSVSPTSQEDGFVLNTKEMSQEYAKTCLAVMNILRWSFNDIIHACAKSDNFILAEQLFMQMLDMRLKPSQHTYDGFVKAAINAKGVAYSINVVRMMQKIGLQPYNDTFAAISIGCSKNLNLDLAEDFCEKITDNSPKYIHTFNSLLTACDIMGEPERAIRVLARLKNMSIKKNIRTYELMFSLFGTVNFPFEKGNLLSHADVCKRISIIETDMAKNGIQHSYTSMKNLIKALGAEGLIREMLQYLNVAESMLWQMDAYQETDLYTNVLHALVNADETHKAIEMFKSMRSSGLPATVATYNTMIECCSILASLKSASALLSLMLRDGISPQKITFNALIKVMISTKDFEGALGVVDNLLAEGIEPDIELFNTILREAYFEGRIDIIELIIESIHRKKIQPDPSTLWYTFSAYVECDFHNTAIEALQVMSMRMISEENKILEQNRIASEELIYSEDPDVEVQILKNFKESEEFIATALLNLRWCAMMGSSISWSPDASPWAKRLSFSYETRKGVV